jgi:predicted aconitase
MWVAWSKDEQVKLTAEEQRMLDGGHGPAVQKAMEILVGLATVYGAERMIPITSAQIAGVSYDNLGIAGLQFLNDLAGGGGQARVLATLNPAGMDIENWRALGIHASFARDQMEVLEAFAQMEVVTTCTCTPYLVGNTPHCGEHIAWAESSAVCYANSVLGARTNREGGPSALAAALTGRTPEYGYHLDSNRAPTVTVQVRAPLADTSDYGALGQAIGRRLETAAGTPVPYIEGIAQVSADNLKSLCASIATYGGVALFHIPGVTPGADRWRAPPVTIEIGPGETDAAKHAMCDAEPEEIDFVSLGCPHLSVGELARVAQLLGGKRVKKEFWVTTARPTRVIADRRGYIQTIEASGAVVAADTCCVVAPIRGRFRAMATDSAKACYYARARNGFRTLLRPFDQVVQEALR